MASKYPTAKIIDLTTALDAELVITAAGAVLWASVEIIYAAEDVSPTVTIRVPVPWLPEEGDLQRRDKAVRAARQLIDHACVAMPPPASEDRPGILQGTVLEGLVQELGLSEPTTKPLRRGSR